MQTNRMVKLPDGRLVDSGSEAWRLECARREQLALEVAQLPRFELRSARVAAVRRRDGDELADWLTGRLRELRQARIEQAKG